MFPVLIANSAASLVMTGLIWFVQNVHYPLLARVKVEHARGIALDHQRRTSQVVAVPMAIEGLTTLALLYKSPPGVSWFLPWVNAIVLAVALGCTIFLSVPLHSQMARDPKPETGRRLVTTNWPRTVAWTMRGALCIAMVMQAWNARA